MKSFDIRESRQHIAKRATWLSSLLSEGHQIVGDLDNRFELKTFLRHANGNRSLVLVTQKAIYLIVNGFIRKTEHFTSQNGEPSENFTFSPVHVKNPK